ncbi:MAG: AsnC family transcriptional regulator [Alphaproteobacteria bacterium]|nr:AsnC family transcriptional regulator [Alphaproteobacteria bacterium]
MILDDTDRLIVRATQEGLPLDPQPYHRVAEALNLDPADVMTRVRRMLDGGAIRRIGVIPNHYALGYTFNGMTVWDVDDARVSELGAKVGALDFVSHCYHRPRHLPLWRYNLFAMVHGRSKDAVERQVERIAELLGDETHDHRILYSTRILKKTGLRIKETG